MTADAWVLSFDHYDPEDEGRREALCATGNGYFVTRAAAAEAIDRRDSLSRARIEPASTTV